MERKERSYLVIAGLQSRISINTMERNTKTSWGLTCMTMEQGIMTQQLEDG